MDPLVGADRMGVLGFGLSCGKSHRPCRTLCLMRRLRSAAAAMERARIARELHDA